MQQDREVPGSIPSYATRRYKSVQSIKLLPGNWAEPSAVTWGLGIQGAARTRGLHANSRSGMCIKIYATEMVDSCLYIYIYIFTVLDITTA